VEEDGGEGGEEVRVARCDKESDKGGDRRMGEIVFGRKREARKRIRCYICGLEKEMTFGEFAEHVRGHIKNGEVSDGIVGECVEWNQNI